MCRYLIGRCEYVNTPSEQKQESYLQIANGNNSSTVFRLLAAVSKLVILFKVLSFEPFNNSN